MVKIPNRLEDLYPSGALEMIMDVMQRPGLSAKVREALDRVGLRDRNPLEQVQHAWQQARSWIESLASDGGQQTEAINATGQLFRPELANCPIGISIAQVFATGSTRFQSRVQCEKRLEHTLNNTLGAHSACWTTSTFAAIESLIANRHVLIPKTDLVRIPRVGDVASMLTRFELTEVGPANGCSPDDWQSALSQLSDAQRQSSCIFTVSPNTLDHSGTLAQNEAVRSVAKKFDIPTFGLVADAVANAKLAQEYGFPSLVDELAHGLDVLIAPLELLLGSTPGALMLGDERFLAPAALRSANLGTNLSAPSLSAALLALQLNLLAEDIDFGAIGQLLASPATLQERARRIAIQLHDNGLVASARNLERNTPLGPPPWNRYTLQNWAVEIRAKESLSKLQQSLLSGEQDEQGKLRSPIVAATQGDLLWIDLRFVDPKDDHVIVTALSPTPFEPAPDTSATPQSA